MYGGTRSEHGGDRTKDLLVARAQVVAFTQRQPFGREAAHASFSNARAKIAPDCRQVGSIRAAANAASDRRRRKLASEMTERSATASAAASLAFTSKPAS